MILIKNKVECNGYWRSRREGVIFVSLEADIDILFNELVKQDYDWKYYKKLIKVAPKEIESKNDLISYCHYVGTTEIYNVKEIKRVVDFTLFQYRRVERLEV